MGQVAVYSDVERRRRWSDDERLRILGEAFSPGAIVTQVARRYDVSTALIYTWRRKMLDATAQPVPASSDPGFVEAVMMADRPSSHLNLAPVIVVDLARGRHMSIFASASPALVAATLKALR
ncbi:transposase [Sphingomonas sp. BIUV-7]|uniref:Transposase n=1 Tax=Sphingomonas natans TaxID=3063330 RepID=A0ABT8YCN1_9SPHN|nr:transposase [Sphingomonas sp. BIUV-7]MDO6416078.1 transposase [Sphingomonas sp. BIUV-7]